jgi:ParB-like chromosome segregation protein Spo0J
MENILLSQLRPNPRNPRQDLGDLTELAESIRAVGILQNLTVVREYQENDPDEYIVVIGHLPRRAGISDVRRGEANAERHTSGV